jgi:hypothetical protein
VFCIITSTNIKNVNNKEGKSKNRFVMNIKLIKINTVVIIITLFFEPFDFRKVNCGYNTFLKSNSIDKNIGKAKYPRMK